MTIATFTFTYIVYMTLFAPILSLSTECLNINSNNWFIEQKLRNSTNVVIKYKIHTKTVNLSVPCSAWYPSRRPPSSPTSARTRDRQCQCHYDLSTSWNWLWQTSSLWRRPQSEPLESYAEECGQCLPHRSPCCPCRLPSRLHTHLSSTSPQSLSSSAGLTTTSNDTSAWIYRNDRANKSA